MVTASIVPLTRGTNIRGHAKRREHMVVPLCIQATILERIEMNPSFPLLLLLLLLHFLLLLLLLQWAGCSSKPLAATPPIRNKSSWVDAKPVVLRLFTFPFGGRLFALACVLESSAWLDYRGPPHQTGPTFWREGPQHLSPDTGKYTKDTKRCHLWLKWHEPHFVEDV